MQMQEIQIQELMNIVQMALWFFGPLLLVILSDFPYSILAYPTLEGGTIGREGRIEMDEYRGYTGSVCSVGWTEHDANLLCKLLGYEGADEHLVYRFEEGNGNIWSNITGCIDRDYSTECSPINSTTDPECTHSKDVGVVCSKLDIRLVGGNSNEGRVEFKYYNQWSVTSDLRLTEADIICRSLNFPSAEFSECGIFGTVYGVSSYGIMCLGNEQEISDCRIDYTSWWYFYRYRDNQYGIRCLKDGVKLTGGQVESEGLLEVYTASEWHTVCFEEFDLEAGIVVCRQLNFDRVLDIISVNYSSNLNVTSSISCSGTENRFEYCSFETGPTQMCRSKVYLLCGTSGLRLVDGYSMTSGYAQFYNNGTWTYVCKFEEEEMHPFTHICLQQQTTGVHLARHNYNFRINYDDPCLTCSPLRCYSSNESHSTVDYDEYHFIECDTERVRMQNRSHHGLVEVFRNGNWNYVCNEHWNEKAAEIACKELHFLGVKSWESGNRTSLVIGAEVIRCLGTEPSLLECKFENVICTNDIVQLTCSDVGIRFKGSVVEYAGRVEIYDSHTWWTVCDDHWSINDANAACRMAGYPEAIKAYGYSTFGEGTDPIIANDFHCSGEENCLWDCYSTKHRDGYCTHNEDASLICSTKLVRLSDGSHPSAGRVEVFISGQWGTVCDDNWDMNDAKVVCRQLDFTTAIASYGSARHGPGIGSIHLDEVQCLGNETDLLLCKSSQTHDCEHSEDASVSCFVDVGINTFFPAEGGCHEYWFPSDKSCLTVIHSTTTINNISNISCPHGSTFLSVSTSSIQTITKYLGIFYGYEENTIDVLLWEKVYSECVFLRWSPRSNSLEEEEMACAELNISAYICQQDMPTDNHTTCPDNQFTCTSGTCILSSLQCDGNFDCPDKSDEAPHCIQDCYQTTDGSDYRGTRNFTEEQVGCLKWTSHVKGTGAIYPEDYIGKGIGDHNFCRNPNERRRPWCYTEDFYEIKDCRVSDCVSEPDNNCPITSFRCLSGHCIPYSFCCDHKSDCPDNSDEAGCTFINCTESEFACDNGRCLESSSRCNAVTDCIDGSDEKKCGKCSSNFLRCSDGKCLHPKYTCDGIPDCPDGPDEKNCESVLSTSVCGTEKFKCQNQLCIDLRYLCLLDYDHYLYIKKGCRDNSHLQNCDSYECPPNTYKCPDSYCITIKSRCDGHKDCAHGEDEDFCDDYDCPGYFKCQDASNCISQDRVCDDIKDCLRGDDELFCNLTCPDGCNCQGLSYICTGTEWTKYKAELIPQDIRYLNVSKVSVQPFKGVSRDELLFMKLQYHYLVALDISGNNIRAITNNMFNELVNLKRLYIQENKLTKLEDNVFENANNLLYLDMHGNGIKQLNRHTFSGLTKLEYLDISDNNIDLENKDIFVDLQSLKTLKSDDYFFCCLLDSARTIDCTPTADTFSSCENLMQNQVIRVFLWIFGLSALLGNMFVIVWRWKHWPTARGLCSKQYILITNLAVADMLMGIYMLIIATADVLFRNDYVIHANNWKASVACTFAGVLAFLSSESSVYILSVISFDRFLHIAFPFANFHFTQKTIKGVIAFGWVLTLVMSILPVLPIPYFNNEFYGVTSVCLALPLTSEKVRGWEYTAAIIIGFNTFCFLVIFVCYTAIFIFIKASSRNIEQTGTNNSDKNQHITIAMRMAVIVATDFCCWVPIIVMGILSLTRTVYIPPEAYAWAAVFVLPINSAINPYLYTFVTLKKRQKQRNVSKYVKEKTNECSGMKTGEREYGTHFTKMSNEKTVVEMIENIIRSQKLSDDSVNVEILQHLSEVLDLAKKYNTDISQIDVGNHLQPNIVTTTTKL